MWTAIFLIFISISGLILVGVLKFLRAGNNLELIDEDEEYDEMALLIVLIDEGIL